MIEVRHYSNVFKSKSFHTMISDFGESNTDQSGIRPDISSARAVIASYPGNNNKVGVYDFDDGKDNGDRLMTFLRSKSLDPTEIDSAMQYALRNAENLKQSDIDKFIADNEKSDANSLRQALKDFFSKSEKSSNAQEVDSKV